MFTGIVEATGVVRGLRRGADAAVLSLRTPLSRALRRGDSLAVQGVCLTVAGRGPGRVAMTAVAETLARTKLGALRAGDRVNLERAVRAGQPLGGHLVQGHVDGVGSVRARRARGDSLELTFRAPAALRRYLVEKGSVAVDGVSLTVAALAADGFRVALVPYTLRHTTLGALRPGDRVNLEVDVVAKYVVEQCRRLLAGRRKGRR